MRSPLIVGLMVLTLATDGLATAALAQPYGDYHRDYRGGEPPQGWGRQQWDYRQRYEHRRGYRHENDDNNASIIAGVLGFALGAAIAGSQQDREATQQRLHDRAWVASCARRYRSFDPNSGTYLGADGFRHYCR